MTPARSMIVSALLALAAACASEPAAEEAAAVQDTVVAPDCSNTDAVDDRFESWYEQQWFVRNALWHYPNHRTCMPNGGGCYQAILQGVLHGARPGALILQIRIERSGDGPLHSLVFFDEHGAITRTVEGLYYLHLDESRLLVSLAMANDGEWGTSYYKLHERLAAVSLDGIVLWQQSFLGPPVAISPRAGPSTILHGSELLRLRDDRLLYTYFQSQTPTPFGGSAVLDPATGAAAIPVSALALGRLCPVQGGSSPACDAMFVRAITGFEQWYQQQPFVITGVPLGDHYVRDPTFTYSYQTRLLGYLPTSSGGMAVQVAIEKRTVGSDRTFLHQLVFFDATDHQIASIAGLYYYHPSDDTLIVSRAMGTSGAIGLNEWPWYHRPEHLAAVTEQGAIRWEVSGLGGMPLGAPNPGGVDAWLTTAADGALVWSYTVTNGGADAVVIDPSSGAALPSPNLRDESRLCTAWIHPTGGTPRSYQLAQDEPIPDRYHLIQSIYAFDPGRVRSTVRLTIDLTHPGWVSEVSIVLSKSGRAVSVPLPASGASHLLTTVELTGFDGVQLSGLWSLKVSDRYSTRSGRLHSWKIELLSR